MMDHKNVLVVDNLPKLKPDPVAASVSWTLTVCFCTVAFSCGVALMVMIFVSLYWYCNWLLKMT